MDGVEVVLLAGAVAPVVPDVEAWPDAVAAAAEADAEVLEDRAVRASTPRPGVL